MKKHILALALLAFALVSCEKHQILYDTHPLGENNAEYQLHYMEPITAASANYIDSVYINGILTSSVKGSGQLATYNGVPGGATGRFFAAPAGLTTVQLYRGGNEIYNKQFTLTSGKQNVIIHDLNKEPIVIDNGFPYNHLNTVSDTLTAAGWNTDSIATVKFVNLLYEDNTTPYAGKLQYQWQDPRTKEWKDCGKAVAFGEATERVPLLVVKSVFNSNGYCRINYRIKDEDGNLLKVANSSLKMVDYSDYWNAYIGRSYMHFFSGVRTAKPVCSVRQWTSL